MKYFVLVCALLMPITQLAAQEYFGEFDDGPEGRFIRGDDRPVFELIRDFGFRDPNGLAWMAPKGAVVNGASIPQAFWSIIGGPFEGEYLKASVIHDHFCGLKTRTAHDTHRNFYYGMRANGVPEWKARTMYWAVSAFGPDWTLERRIVPETICRITAIGQACTTTSRIEEGVKVLQTPDLEDPEVLAVALGKINAIARTLKTTDGTTLDVTLFGQVDASPASIEANAAAFRQVITSNDFKINPSLVGVIGEPKQFRFDEVQSWPQNTLPSFEATATFENVTPGTVEPFVLAPGDVKGLSDRLELEPTSFEFQLQR